MIINPTTINGQGKHVSLPEGNYDGCTFTDGKFSFPPHTEMQNIRMLDACIDISCGGICVEGAEVRGVFFDPAGHEYQPPFRDNGGDQTDVINQIIGAVCHNTYGLVLIYPKYHNSRGVAVAQSTLVSSFNWSADRNQGEWIKVHKAKGSKYGVLDPTADSPLRGVFVTDTHFIDRGKAAVTCWGLPPHVRVKYAPTDMQIDTNTDPLIEVVDANPRSTVTVTHRSRVPVVQIPNGQPSDVRQIK